MKALIILTIYFITTCIFSISYSQNNFTYKIDISPKAQPKDALSKFTENLNFKSRRVQNDIFIIESTQDLNTHYFDSIASLIGENLILFDKTISKDVYDEYEVKACCNITIDMYDSWGDGWNGGFLEVSINGGAPTVHSVSNLEGAYDQDVVTGYCDGDQIEITFTGGSFVTEVDYIISSPAGTLISTLFTNASGEPSEGTIFLSSNACSSTTSTPTAQDCEGAQVVCSNNSFSGNSDGGGTNADLSPATDGCLSGEYQSSWYYVNVGSAGTLEMTINPSSTDDYDFAIWGPFDETTANANCPPITNPTRCSYALDNGDTGMASGSSGTSESEFGDGWISPLNVQANEIYILLIDNYSGSNNPFNLDWGGSAGLDCTPVTLPVELLSFKVESISNANELTWTTASETNNDYFILEHSSNGENWNEIKKISGAGNSTVENAYYTTHRDFQNGINYYRLKQVDFDGTLNTYKVVSIDNTKNRTLLKKVNLMGQEVNDQYKGVIIEYYSDGYVKKTYQR